MGDNLAMKNFLLAPILLVFLAACSRDAPSGPPADIRPVRAEQVGWCGVFKGVFKGVLCGVLSGVVYCVIIGGELVGGE